MVVKVVKVEAGFPDVVTVLGLVGLSGYNRGEAESRDVVEAQVGCVRIVGRSVRWSSDCLIIGGY